VPRRYLWIQQTINDESLVRRASVSVDTTNDQVRIRNTIILAAMGSVETTASSVGALRQGNGSAAVACLSVMGMRERERWRKEVASGHVPCRTLSHVSLQLRGASGNAKLGSEDAALCRPGNSSYGSLRYALTKRIIKSAEHRSELWARYIRKLMLVWSILARRRKMPSLHSNVRGKYLQ
jgi:hypothetical protein